LPELGSKVALVDPVLGFVVLLGMRSIAHQPGSPAAQLLKDAAPWLWLILLASIGSLYGVGFAGSTLLNTATSIFSYTLFFCAYQLFLDRRDHLGLFRTTLLITVVFVVVTLALDIGSFVRAQGTFQNPNYAAHFLVASLLVTWPRAPSRGYAGVLAVGTLGLVLTASFGGLSMLLSVAGYEAFRRLRSRPHLLAVAAAAALVLAWTAVEHRWELEPPELRPTQALSTDRLERSQEGRLNTWRQSLGSLESSPFGIGPDGVRRTGLAGGKEAHNSYIAYLVERGAFGLLGLLGLGVVLWRRAEPGGGARRLLIAFAVGNAVRETLHYRHMWLTLALAFAWEAAERQRDVAAQAVAR